jgi:hypothetical protein
MVVNNSTKMAYVMRSDEQIWNVSVLQTVQIYNFITITTITTITITIALKRLSAYLFPYPVDFVLHI